MMSARHKIWYWVFVLAAAALTVLYAEKRNLCGRYLEYQDGLRQLHEIEEQCARLESEVDASEKRVAHLADDPFEIEASIRQTKGFVREDETVFRLKEVQTLGQ